MKNILIHKRDDTSNSNVSISVKEFQFLDCHRISLNIVTVVGSACRCGDHGGQCGRTFCPIAFGFYKDYRQHADCHYAEFCCLPSTYI